MLCALASSTAGPRPGEVVLRASQLRRANSTSLRIDIALQSGVGRPSGVSVWRRRGNWNARGGPSSDLMKLGLGQFTVSRFVHLLACPGSAGCGSHILPPFAEMSEADIARSGLRRRDRHHGFVVFG